VKRSKPTNGNGHKPKKPNGHGRAFAVSARRVIARPVPLLYTSFYDPRTRRRWLKVDGLIIRKAATNKSLQITWGDGVTSLEISFCPRGDDKAQVVLAHRALKDERAALEMRRFWQARLDELKGMLEAQRLTPTPTL
jgi:uncharacterized protein YndB with AHSA1/START domain